MIANSYKLRCERCLIEFDSADNILGLCYSCFNKQNDFITGWRCPVCKAVYSPYTTKCSNCMPQVKYGLSGNIENMDIEKYKCTCQLKVCEAKIGIWCGEKLRQ